MIAALGRAFWRRVARADELVQLRQSLADANERAASAHQQAEMLRRQLAASEDARRQHAQDNARLRRTIDKALTFGGQLDDWDLLAWATVASILKGEIA